MRSCVILDSDQYPATSTDYENLNHHQVLTTFLVTELLCTEGQATDAPWAAARPTCAAAGLEVKARPRSRLRKQKHQCHLEVHQILQHRNKNNRKIYQKHKSIGLPSTHLQVRSLFLPFVTACAMCFASLSDHTHRVTLTHFVFHLHYFIFFFPKMSLSLRTKHDCMGL